LEQEWEVANRRPAQDLAAFVGLTAVGLGLGAVATFGLFLQTFLYTACGNREPDGCNYTGLFSFAAVPIITVAGALFLAVWAIIRFRRTQSIWWMPLWLIGTIVGLSAFTIVAICLATGHLPILPWIGATG
jgi:hypothetical protein